MLLITRVSPGYIFLTSRLYPGRSKSFPDCLSQIKLAGDTPNSSITRTCLSSFCSRVLTRMYPYNLCSMCVSSITVILYILPTEIKETVTNHICIVKISIHAEIIRYIVYYSTLLWNMRYVAHEKSQISVKYLLTIYRRK